MVESKNETVLNGMRDELLDYMRDTIQRGDSDAKMVSSVAQLSNAIVRIVKQLEVEPEEPQNFETMGDEELKKLSVA